MTTPRTYLRPVTLLGLILSITTIACKAFFPETVPVQVLETSPPLVSASQTAPPAMSPTAPTPTQRAEPPQAIRTPLSTPTAHPTAVEPEDPNPSVIANQETALLPAARADLLALNHLTHYQIQVALNLVDLILEGQSRVDYTNTEDVALDRLNFRLFPNGGSSYGNGSLTVSQVVVDGQPVETQLTVDDSVVEVQLPQELSPGEQAQLEFVFSGVIPRNFGGSETPEGYGIYNFTNDVLALGGWYPILAVYDEDGWNLDPVSSIGDSVYADMAFYTVEVTAPDELVLATTGVEIGRQDEDGFARYQFVTGPVREFFISASPAFKIESQAVAGTTVNSYFAPGHQTGGRKALQVAAEALQIFNAMFGPYPYSELDVVASPMRYAAGVEFPGIILVAENMYNHPTSSFFIETIAHEVAHQWWYNVVGNDVFDDPWLDEALTTYSAALYFQDSGAAFLYRETLEIYQSEFEQAVQRGLDEPVARELAYFEQLGNPGVYGAIVYAKGALFFRHVREAIGDEAFFQALQTYYAAYKYEIARPENLLDAFETAYGKELDELYQEWLY